jgi:hypothetical protein
MPCAHAHCAHSANKQAGQQQDQESNIKTKVKVKTSWLMIDETVRPPAWCGPKWWLICAGCWLESWRRRLDQKGCADVTSGR